MSENLSISSLVQSFFVEHLRNHKGASEQTVSAYRDTFRLLLRFLAEKKGAAPTNLCVDDLDAPAILSFLEHLEHERRNSVRSRNARLAAIRSFFRFVALREPEALAVSTRVLAIPVKRFSRSVVNYLTKAEMEAILAAPDRSERSGRRDHAMLLLLYNTGARVSEITGLKVSQFQFAKETFVKLCGKGRKERSLPLWPQTRRVLRSWLEELGGKSDSYVFPNARGNPLTRYGVAYILSKAVTVASAECESLTSKRVSPHVVRHTTAMHLLQSNVDESVIALWLGHESTETTHVYVEADLAMKERALEKLAPSGGRAKRFRPDDALLGFLDGL